MNILKILRRWARYVIPGHIAANGTSLAYQQEFFLFLTLLITTVASLLSCIIFALIGKPALIALTAFACLMGIAGLGVWYRTKSVRIPVTIVIVGLMVLNVVAMLQTGGLYSVLVFNFAIPQVLALVYYGPQRMMQIFVFLALIVVAFVLTEIIGIIPEPSFLLTSNALIYGGIALTLLYGIFGAFYIADAIRQEAYKELQQERESVQMRVEEATRHLEEQQENITVINYHLEERNTELQEAIQVAEAAKQLQSDFLRNASHEVRTPLAVIMGFGEVLSDQIEQDNIAAHESLNHIAQAGQNLLDIFNSILTLSTIESTGIQLSLVPIHLQEFMETMVQEFIDKAKAKRLSLLGECRVGAGEWIHLDRMYLRQILHHLLSNAVKFTDEGTVSLSCEIVADTNAPASNPASNIVRFTVRDTGIGIAPKFRDKLFAPFHQHDSGQTRLYGGLGLGLAITKHLVEAMNGRVWCEPDLGDGLPTGATFIVELPTTPKS